MTKKPIKKTTKKPLIETNPYLKDPKMRDFYISRSVRSSCGVEGIKDPNKGKVKRTTKGPTKSLAGPILRLILTTVVGATATFVGFAALGTLIMAAGAVLFLIDIA